MEINYTKLQKRILLEGNPQKQKELQEKYEFLETMKKKGRIDIIYFKEIDPIIEEIRNEFGKIIYLRLDNFN